MARDTVLAWYQLMKFWIPVGHCEIMDLHHGRHYSSSLKAKTVSNLSCFPPVIFLIDQSPIPGELLPVTAISPSIDDEDVEQPSGDVMSDDAPPIHTTNKGKRKAPPDESD